MKIFSPDVHTYYGVFNTATNEFAVLPSGNHLTQDKTFAKGNSRKMNEAMKPEFQSYTVATITFDPEV